jgi:hypothetical protein
MASIIRLSQIQSNAGNLALNLNTNTNGVEFTGGFIPASLVIPNWAGENARPTSGISPGYLGYNSTDVQLEVYWGVDPDDGSPVWGTTVGRVQGGGGLKSDMESLNSALDGKSYNDVSGIKAEFEALGFTLIATPTYGGCAESQSGTSNISSTGQFNNAEFDSGTEIELSEGMDNSTMDGYPYMIFAGFGPNGFAGTAVMAYRDYGSGTALKNLFSPYQNRNLYCYVLNKDGTDVTDVSGNTSTGYSNNQQPNSNGYYASNRFAADDGCWGFRIGTTGLNGNGGPYLIDNTSASYGCENRNSGDTAADEFIWSNQTQQNTSSYCFYFCVRYA